MTAMAVTPSAIEKFPPVYRAYLRLGRFRNAIVLDELAHHPTPELQRFVADYSLSGFPRPWNGTGPASSSEAGPLKVPNQN